MKYLFSITQWHDVSNFRANAQMKKSSPTYLFTACVKGHILIKNDAQVPLGVTGG